jgi:hypothetical protein
VAVVPCRFIQDRHTSLYLGRSEWRSWSSTSNARATSMPTPESHLCNHWTPKQRRAVACTTLGFCFNHLLSKYFSFLFSDKIKSIITYFDYLTPISSRIRGCAIGRFCTFLVIYNNNIIARLLSNWVYQPQHNIFSIFLLISYRYYFDGLSIIENCSFYDPRI